MTEETNRCPKCGGEPVPIVYGLVPFIPDGPRPELFKAQERGDLVLGGCCVDPWSPQWHCKKCDLSFGDRDDLGESGDGPDGNKIATIISGID